MHTVGGPAQWRSPMVRKVAGYGAFLAAAVLVELLVAAFIRSKGVALTGDEPSYIIQAQTYVRLSPHILSTIKADLRLHALSAYPPHAPVSSVASFTGPQGMISAFEPGLGLLLIPFVATGRLFLGAVAGMLVLNTAGLMFLHRRVSSLAGLDRRFQIVLGILLASPALLLAVTQIYPDLISGVLLACAIVEVASVERRRRVTALNAVVVAGVAGFLPWLQIKNLVPAVIIVVAFAVVASHSHARARTTGWVAVVSVVGWAVLIAYNLRYFGHVLGLPEPFPRWSSSGIEYSLGMLFDKDQGIFIQMPFAILGLVGLGMALKRLPVSVLASVLGVGSILVLNGTYTSNPYGGLSLAGRFMWTLAPVLLAWAAVVLAGWQRAGRLYWAPFVVAGAAWIYQAAPILAGDHTYYNVYSPTPPWNPASWPGWWPGLDHLLPQFDLPGHSFGVPADGIFVVLAGVAVLAVVSVQYLKPRGFSRSSLAAVAVCALILVGIAASAKPLLPSTTLHYDAVQLGVPSSGGTGPMQSPDVTLQGISPGTYRFTFSYRISGSRSMSNLTVFCNSTTAAPPQVATAALRPAPAGSTVSIQIRCTRPGTVSSQVTVAARDVLTVGSLQLRETAP